MKGISTFLFFLTFATASSATTVSYQGYTLDTDTSIISGEDLEWLRWNETTGMSVDGALNQYQEDGWRVANTQEINSLFTNFQFYDAESGTITVFDGSLSTAFLEWGEPDVVTYDSFRNLFGITSIRTTGRYFNEDVPGFSSVARFIDTETEDGYQIGHASVGDVETGYACCVYPSVGAYVFAHYSPEDLTYLSLIHI